MSCKKPSRQLTVHFCLVTFLVGRSLDVPLGTLLFGESLELSRDNLGNVAKGRVRVLFLDLGTDGHAVKEVGRHVPLGHVRITLGLLLLSSTAAAALIKVIGRNVMLHLLLVTELVGSGLFVPLGLLLLRKFLELSRKEASLCRVGVAMRRKM